MKLPFRAYIFVILLTLLALTSLGYAASQLAYPGAEKLALFAIFIILAVLAEVYATWIPAYKWEISSSIAIYLAALFILGPQLAVLAVLASSLLSELALRWNADRGDQTAGVMPILFNVSQLVVTVTAAGALLRAFNRPALELKEPLEFLLAVAAFGVYFVLNLSLVTGIITLTERKVFRHALAESIRQFFVQYVVLCVSALLLTALYSISVWHVFLALFPLTLVHVSFRSYLRLQTEARKTFERISRLLDERDHYTAVHSSEVAELAVAIAREMGFAQALIDQIDIAARVHDIGKVAVPDSILLKPGPLDEAEWAVMRRHSEVSAELIEGLELYAPVADAVRHEHERWDGTGYPDGLEGERIPIVARVIAAADIYNALTTDRPYREAFSREKTVEIIREIRGTDLDPRVADALLRVIERSELPRPSTEERSGAG